MRTTKNDRRSQRTRQLASKALTDLMLEKRYDDITVQDILDRANIGRSTFYAHYLDKEDLLVSNFTRVLDMFSAHVDQSVPHEPPDITPFLYHVQEYHQLYQALVRSGQIELLYKKGRERLRHNIEQHIARSMPAGRQVAVPLSLIADYIASTLVSMLRWWLDTEMAYTPEQMETFFHQLVLPGVQNLLHTPMDAPNSHAG